MTMRLHADVSIADTDYGTVLLDERSGRYWQLNPTGVLVVRTLLDGGSTEGAVAALTEEFRVDRARAEQDVAALLDGLLDAGLVSSGPGSSSSTRTGSGSTGPGSGSTGTVAS